MKDDWRRAVEEALAQPALQEALQANAQRRRVAWDRAMASLPVSWDEARERGAAIRRRVLAHWDEVLDAFLERVRDHGVVVHRAATAQEARNIVLALAREHGVRRVVKSKSMLTEEIGLNEALEAAGIEVVETDLGEFIVQLRGEKPAHIITPAVHLRRQDVGRVFHERLGVPYTEDVAVMTQVARRHLREKFLQADMGISGVNFGVAETGTLVLVTNEGNGRMVTTAPRLHVAVMGMERLVATMEDLAWMLRLLPRAATGQALTVYVSLLHGPRGAHAPDGPQSRHLVLVDNGRRDLAATPLADILRCIRCGACLNACPVFAHIGGHGYRSRTGTFTPYPGPMGIPVSTGLLGVDFGVMAYLCTLCGACAEVCPVAIPLPETILHVRQGLPKHRPAPGLSGWMRWALKGYTQIVKHPRLFRVAQGFLRSGLHRLGGSSPIPLLRGAAWRARHGTPALARLPSKPAPGPAPQAEGTTSETGETRPLETFLQRARAVDVEVHRIRQAQLAEAVLAWCQQEGIRTLWPWETSHLPSGLLERLLAGGLERQEGPQAHAGLTGARWAIAETGTLVLPGGPGRPLGASLWPAVHLAVVPASAVVARLEDALTRPEVVQSPATVLVTGPSRTADIEMTLTLGVHGPGRLVVFLVDDA